VTGNIERTYFAGQESRPDDQVNSFILRLADGSTVDESIYYTASRISRCSCPAPW
jgi:hypothetical protein